MKIVRSSGAVQLWVTQKPLHLWHHLLPGPNLRGLQPFTCAMNRSPLASCLLAVAFAAPALAQDPTRAVEAQLLPMIERRLEADTAAQVSWAGYLAQRYRVRSASRALCAALDRWKDKDGLEARIARLHLVDGLLGIEARVPTEQVEFLLADRMTRAAALAVMAQDAPANLEGLVRLALAPAEYNEIARRAAARLLVARGLRSKALGKHVVDHLKFTYTASVTDVMEVWDTAEAEAPFIKPKLTKTMPGYPPLVRIELSKWHNAEAMVKMIVPGRVGKEPIVLTRKEKAAYRPQDMRRGKFYPVMPSHELLNLCNHMSGVYIVKHSYYREISWTNAKDFLKSYVPDRDKLRRRMDKAVAGMRKRGWLGSDVPADFRLELVESVSDEREDATVALPEIPAPPQLGQ